jgi:hypothetical protein
MTSTTSWQNTAFTPRTGRFMLSFNSTPLSLGIDGVSAFSASAGSTYDDYAVLVRFNTSGYIEARNRSIYSSDTLIPYAPGQQFAFRLVVDVSQKKYSVYVIPQGQQELALASDYGFRMEQASASQLGWLGITASQGSHTLCGLAINDVHRADTSAPFGCVSMSELNAFIALWKADSTATPMREMMGAVSLWKQGGC